jgi:hypothetical protein
LSSVTLSAGSNIIAANQRTSRRSEKQQCHFPLHICTYLVRFCDEEDGCEFVCKVRTTIRVREAMWCSDHDNHSRSYNHHHQHEPSRLSQHIQQVKEEIIDKHPVLQRLEDRAAHFTTSHNTNLPLASVTNGTNGISLRERLSGFTDSPWLGPSVIGVLTACTAFYHHHYNSNGSNNNNNNNNNQTLSAKHHHRENRHKDKRRDTHRHPQREHSQETSKEDSCALSKKHSIHQMLQNLHQRYAKPHSLFHHPDEHRRLFLDLVQPFLSTHNNSHHPRRLDSNRIQQRSYY